MLIRPRRVLASSPWGVADDCQVSRDDLLSRNEVLQRNRRTVLRTGIISQAVLRSKADTIAVPVIDRL